MEIPQLLMVCVIIVGLCKAQHNICPPSFRNEIQDVFGLSDGRAQIQEGIWHRVPCTTFRPGEALRRVIWYKASSIDDPGRVRLLRHAKNTDFPEDDRYEFSYDFSLVIKGVEESDEGKYVCLLVPRDTGNRVGNIDLEVIGDLFPVSKNDSWTSFSLERDRRHKLPCPCTSQTSAVAPSVVYWSTGPGLTVDTDIVAVRFSDGTILQFQYGADYNIGSDSSLIINSMNSLYGTTRFWCHVFQSGDDNGRQNHCCVDVKVLDGRFYDHALKASATFYYLQMGIEQIIPCASWTPSFKTCKIQWFTMVDGSDKNTYQLSYTVAGDNVLRVNEYDMADEFGLVVKSVDDSHAGEYTCSVGAGALTKTITASVIGDTLPLDGGSVSANSTKTVHTDSKFSLSLPCSNIPTESIATVLWSFGTIDAQITTVIGTLYQPGGSKKISLREGNCSYDISTEGSLLLSECSQVGDVRYWCHVFPFNDVLSRSSVDVIILDDHQQPFSTPLVPIVVVPCVFLVMIITVTLGARWAWRNSKRHSSHDREQGYEWVNVEDMDIDVLVRKVKLFVKEQMSRLPIPLWITKHDACYELPIDDVYTPLEMFVRSNIAECNVRYRLTSESEIFDDGISELSNRHVVIQGREGSGKTTILYKLAYDCYMGTTDALLGKNKLVLVLPAKVLIEADDLGKAVIQCMFQGDTDISAASINEYCIHHASNVSILIDDCTNVSDMAGVIKVVKQQGLFDCHLVMTTTHAQQIRKVCEKYNLRHVTVTGFTPKSAHLYVDNVFDTVKAKKSKYTNTTEATKMCSSLNHYLDTSILRPELARLPSTLMALCQLCIWTKGQVFRPDVNTGNLFSRLVECIFDNDHEAEGGTDDDVPFEDRKTRTKLQLGRQALRDSLGVEVNFERVTKPNVSFRRGRQVSESSCTSVVSDYYSQASDEISETESTCQISKSDPLEQEDQKLHHLSSAILQDFYAGNYVAFPENYAVCNTLIDELSMENVDKLANVFLFACRQRPNLCTALVHSLTKIVSRQGQTGSLSVLLQLQRVIELCLQLNFEGKFGSKLIETLRFLFDEGTVRLIGLSSFMIRILSYLLKHAQPTEHSGLKIRSVELLRIGQHDWKEIQECLECLAPGTTEDLGVNIHKGSHNSIQVRDDKSLTLNQVRQRIESGDSDMPRFPPDQSDANVLRTVQSLGLQDLMDSQAGECHLSSAAHELALCLPAVKSLESIILMGTILSSKDLCNLARDLDKLPVLQKLDLRLNKQFDDGAFAAVTNSLHTCMQLTDLRLSLYKVTTAGFEYVRKGMKEFKGKSWRRLRTLYLLHGSPAESFVSFLSATVGYLHLLACLHISCSNPNDEIPDSVADEFLDSIRDPKVMPYLEEFVIDNMHSVEARLASLKSSKVMSD